MSALITRTLLCCTLIFLTQCCPPPLSYVDSPTVISQRLELQDQLLTLLPSTQQELPEAIEEATWLADTSYKAAVAIAIINDSCWSHWMGNYLINLNFQDRGLCWHYQHDMFRELRRRKLSFFRLGTCVRDSGEMSEHNCLYIAPISDPWPRAYMLDAWANNGKLEVKEAWRLKQRRWKDSPLVATFLMWAYPAGHQHPIELWLRIKNYKGDYEEYWTQDAIKSPQYHRMYDNIQKGKLTHPDKPYSY